MDTAYLGEPYYGLDLGFLESIVVASVVVLAVLMVLYVFYYGAVLVAESVMFTKAGEKPWKAVIPVYNTYILFKLCWSVKAFVWYIISVVVYSIGYGISEGIGYGVGSVIFSVISCIGAIAMIVLSIILMVKIANAFGKGGGFAVGLVFLTGIFYMILAFGKSEYVLGTEDNDDVLELSKGEEVKDEESEEASVDSTGDESLEDGKSDIESVEEGNISEEPSEDNSQDIESVEEGNVVESDNESTVEESSEEDK